MNIPKFLAEISLRLKDIEKQEWEADIYNDVRTNALAKNKLRTFRSFKKNYEFEAYLSQVINIKHRIALTKLRISDHDLQIERERYAKPYKPAKERICPICFTGVEDETHFITKCDIYKQLREKVIKDLDLLDPTDKHLFHSIINPNPKNTKHTRQAAKFVYECIKLRQSTLRR